jgi:hypothetical protein
VSNRARVVRILAKFAVCIGAAFVVVLLVGGHIQNSILGGLFGVVSALVALFVGAVWTVKERYP